ncbi:putative bifunctional diguanylate cyclase/phosphodiesterase [Thiorhodovibrio winogradskyi]|nr:EAL domain-containing protein [Thiorhodovibrio winogradskyi]
MWQRLGIRTQLIVLVGLLLTLVAALVLGLTYWLDVRDRQTMAIEQAATLHRALSQDLLKALIDPGVEGHADLSFRLAGFRPLDGLVLWDSAHEPVYHYQREDVDAAALTRSQINTPVKAPGNAAPAIGRGHLSLCEPLAAGGARFGSACYALDLTRYHTGLRQRLISLSMLYAVALSVALAMAFWIGGLYTRPFTALASTMRSNDPRANRYRLMQTRARNEVGALYTGYNAMIDQIVRATDELRYLSRHDTLTGLLNRFGFDQTLEHCLGATGAAEQRVDVTISHVLVQIDLDLFKLVNDSAGQLAGDFLLKQVAQLCRDHWPAPAALARIGGDEFFALLPDCDEDRARRETWELLERIGELRFRWEQSAFDITASAGLVAFSPYEYRRDDLIAAANSALKQAQMRGHHQLHCHRADAERQRRESAERFAASAIKEALRAGPARFELFAQPIVPLESPESVSKGFSTSTNNYEILLRLRTGNGELMSPGLFLPAAERYQLMSAIDQYVFAAFFDAMEQHPAHLDALGFASINLSGSTLTHPDFQAWFGEVLSQRDFPWYKLVVEVTETTAVGNLPQASDFISRCRAAGVRVALDDFGTGLSSFEYLKSLPFDRIKIDGSFIRDMLTDPVDYETVRYIHQIARLRDQRTIAEFVETEAQLAALSAIGVDYGQGYLLGRPRPLVELFDEGSPA